MRAGYREVVRPERLVWTEPDVEGGTDYLDALAA
jgi:hypothetical protein